MHTQNTQAIDAAGPVLFEDPALLGIDLSEDDDEEDDLIGVLDGIKALLDDAEGLSPLQKAKLTGELLKLKKALQAGEVKALDKARASARMLAIRKELGVVAAAVVRPEVAFLAEVGAGKHDGLEIAALLDKIGAAIDALLAEGALTTEAETAADQALVKWADLEQRANG